ncbi:MAG: endo-1,4-beta-xylanase [Chloroflexota bacterium]
MSKTQISSNRYRRYVIGALASIALLVTGIVTIIAVRPQPDPFAGDAITDPPFTTISYSIQTFLWWDEGNAGMQASMVNRVLNFGYIKQNFPWRELEPRQNEWDFTQSDRIIALADEWDLGLIVRLGQAPQWATGSDIESDESHDAPPNNLEDMADYCGTIAERYAGQVVAYQIWNEPNLAREWGTNTPNAEDYVALLAVCSEAIRAVDSEAILISAGLSPTGGPMPYAMPDDQYLDAMYRAAFQQYIDVVGVHAPGFSVPSYGPDDAAADGMGRWASFRRVEDLRKIMLLHDDAARQMAILEFGFTTDTENSDYAWFSVTEEEQARLTVDAYVYVAENWRPWVGLMSLIYMPNPRWTPADEEWWWAVGESDGTMRRVFFSLAQMDRYCGDEIQLGWQADWSEEEWFEQRDTCP